MCLLFCQRQTSYTDLKPLTHLSRADPSSDVEQDDLPPATAGEAPATAGEGWSSRIRDCGRGVVFTHPQLREDRAQLWGLPSCGRPFWHQSARLSACPS